MFVKNTIGIIGKILGIIGKSLGYYFVNQEHNFQSFLAQT